MRKIGFFITGIIVIIVITACFFIFFDKKVAYVNTYQLYEEFKLKKELEEKLKKTQLSRQVILDSIKSKIQLVGINKDLSDQMLADKIQELRQTYFLKEKQFSQENESQAQQYTDQVWEQLNQYVKDYGKEHRLKYILGANGQGSIMYADESNDITKELIEYVNEKYQGIH